MKAETIFKRAERWGRGGGGGAWGPGGAGRRKRDVVVLEYMGGGQLHLQGVCRRRWPLRRGGGERGEFLVGGGVERVKRHALERHGSIVALARLC